MPNILEITGNDIALLNDADLRNLIGLLCEADFRLAGLPTMGITWGGHQDAKDGGLDVAVRSTFDPPPNSFVSRKVTGFQVKKPDMSKVKILNEMKPNGVLREEIKNLIKESGAYIIVSSTGSTTESALKNRTEAMEKAVVDEDNHQNLHLEFYDRGRIASWVRNHPSMILWVRNKIGRHLNGWHPYENWAKTPGGIDEEFLLDDGLRFFDGTQSDKQMPIRDGLQKLRQSLMIGGSPVRLTGLSGVGKTRLVQALFDEKIGEQVLNRTVAFYTDLSDSPNPNPILFAELLIAEKRRAVLIVDNCPPDTHRRLTEICSGGQNNISLLTIEYDVRDDIPEETHVFRLEPASEELIEKLVIKRFSYINSVDARTIARISGGNARVAIALANTVKEGESVSGFRDSELFERLFHQRYDSNENLLISAEVCALVYSFDVGDVNSEQSELKFLASLAEKTVDNLYRDVATLKKRNLIQSRDKWRAVLPHAIANQLAKRAFEFMHKDTIVNVFLNNASERLLKSFTRRLYYLHDCPQVIEIVNDWLASDGWLGKKKGKLNDFEMDIIENIAPVSPEKILDFIEDAVNSTEGIWFVSPENPNRSDLANILRHLAYDPFLFDRCVNLLCRFALSEGLSEKLNSTRGFLKSLFHLYLSGTYATVEQRGVFVGELLNSTDKNKQILGLCLMDAALESRNFTSFQNFNFGARPRDYGYQPKITKDSYLWYKFFIDICTRLAISEQPISERIRDLFAHHLRGLCRKGYLLDLLENSVKKIHKKQMWTEGWIEVRKIIYYDGKDAHKKVLEILYRLEKILKPNDLIELARAYALSNNQILDLDEDESSDNSQKKETPHGIGVQVAQDIDVFNALLSELVSTHSTQLFDFGEGLAEGCADKYKIWDDLYGQLKKTPDENRSTRVFFGFLSFCEKNDFNFYNSKLDDLVNDDLLGGEIPLYQNLTKLDQKAIERLHKSLDSGKTKISSFKRLSWGRHHESIGDDDLAVLLNKILAKEDGICVAIEILMERFCNQKKKPSEYSNKLISIGREILSMYSFPKGLNRQNNFDHELALIVCMCLNGVEAIDAATQICNHLLKAINDNQIYNFDYPDLLCNLAWVQPSVFLDVFLRDEIIENYQFRGMFSDGFDHHGHPFNQISDENIISWCERDPRSRYPAIALTIEPFSTSSETGGLVWKPIVYAIFEKAPNLSLVLEYLEITISPMSWSGSKADILQNRSVLFQSLYEHEKSEIQSWAKSRYVALQKRIKEERESEEQRYREQDETFE